MSHSDSLKNVPTIDSKEFENFLKNNGFQVKTFDNSNKEKSIPEDDSSQSPNTSTGMQILNTINEWCDKNPGKAMLILLGGSAFILCKISVSLLSQAIFKGNVKTAKYFNKHSM